MESQDKDINRVMLKIGFVKGTLQILEDMLNAVCGKKCSRGTVIEGGAKRKL